jgi:hypothetical protein
MIQLSPRTVVELPPDQLGLIQLADLNATGAWSEWNYVNEANKGK